MADNLFATASRENLAEATLLLVRASEIMGPLPQAVPPPPRADASFPLLSPISTPSPMPWSHRKPAARRRRWRGGGGPMPAPETFYFKIPPNSTCSTSGRRSPTGCTNCGIAFRITGQPLALPLFDAPLDPGLLAAAEAAGVDLASILNDLSAPLAELPLRRAVRAGDQVLRRRPRLRRAASGGAGKEGCRRAGPAASTLQQQL